MPTIDQLSRGRVFDPADEVAIFSKAIGTTVKGTLEQVADVVRDTIAGAPDETVYSVSTDGVALLPATPGGSFWARLELSAPAPNATLILPGTDDRADGQEVLVTCTQTIAALVINAGDAAVIGAPASIGPTAPFRLKFDLISLTWNRIS